METDLALAKLVVRAAVGCVAILAVVVGGCNMHRTQAIASSADPLAAACALSPQNNDACIAVGIKR